MTDLKRYRMLINGEWVGAEDGKTFASVNPTSQQDWAEIPEATADDVDRAVKAAHAVFSEGPWASFTPTERGRHLRKLRSYGTSILNYGNFRGQSRACHRTKYTGTVTKGV